MAINAYGDNIATNGVISTAPSAVEDKTILGKDDFMMLLLVELQHQDPTEPMDSAKILTQTSQLASLESAENTNKALEDLAKSLSNTQQFTTIAAIGKTADLGSDAIAYEEGSPVIFELYFPDSIASGSIEITDASGAVVQTIDVGTNPAGVYEFTWDGMDSGGNIAETGVYHVNATYADADGNAQATRLGAYPIESVRFDGGQTLVKVGSNYVPLSQVKEVY